MYIQLIDHTEDPESLICNIAYLSKAGLFKPYSGNTKDFIQKLLNWKHFSVFEFASATFYIEGISRTCSHQIVRHRLFSFLQKSDRYSEISKDFIIPESIQNSSYKDRFEEIKQESINLYNEMIESNISREDARFIIPQAVSTSLIMKGNFRTWMHFLKLRLAQSAQWEIREVAEKIFENLSKISPIIFSINNLLLFE